MEPRTDAKGEGEPQVSPSPSPPDHRAFLGHVAAAPFQSGSDRGRWRLLDPILWPHAYIAVAAPARPASPNEWVFRFDLQAYPHQPPTAEPWDVIHHTALPPAKWPVGIPGGRFALAFNPNWNAHALYLPCDRLALAGHDAWLTAHPHLIWYQDKDITFYLNILHDYFHSRDYQGARPT